MVSWGGGVGVWGVRVRGFEVEVGGGRVHGEALVWWCRMPVLTWKGSRRRRLLFGKRRDIRVVDIVAPQMPWLDERGFDVKGVGFVEHAFDETFDGVLGGTVGPQARDAEGAGRAAEDEVAPSYRLLRLFRALVFLFHPCGRRAGRAGSEVGQAGVEDVDGSEEVGLELIADVVIVLIFAGTDDAVAGADGDDIDAAEMGNGLLDHSVHSGADADVAEER